MLKSVADIEEVSLVHNVRADGELVVAQEGKELPFFPVRLFTVRAIKGAVRGKHAHKRCTQFLISVHGAIDVECDDGTSKRRFSLDRGNKGLLIPPSIWGVETYLTDVAVLAVLCDRHYAEDDYLRDYDQFCAWRRG